MESPRPNPRVYAVAELTHRIKALVENDIGSVLVEGECSNVRRPASGHLYFTLKDAEAQISAVFFRGAQRDVAIMPADGAQVKLSGSLTVYPRGGNYQIIVQRVEPAGVEAFVCGERRSRISGWVPDARCRLPKQRAGTDCLSGRRRRYLHHQRRRQQSARQFTHLPCSGYV